MATGDNLDPLQQWLAFAPQGVELPAGKKWHVFLSYRSVHRDWALHLYDAFTQVGFKVFLDQFNLVAGASLVTSLAQALSDSGNPSLDTVLRVAKALGLRLRAAAA